MLARLLDRFRVRKRSPARSDRGRSKWQFRPVGEALEPRTLLATVVHPTITLSDQEQLMLELVNRARANPDAEWIRQNSTAHLNENVDTLTVSSIGFTPTTTQLQAQSAASADDYYNGRTLLLTSGALQNQATRITDYTASNRRFIYNLLPSAPANNDTFVVGYEVDTGSFAPSTTQLQSDNPGLSAVDDFYNSRSLVFMTGPLKDRTTRILDYDAANRRFTFEPLPAIPGNDVVFLIGPISSSPKQPLAPNASLHSAANAHSQDMINRDFFDHVNPDGKSPSDRSIDAGYPNFPPPCSPTVDCMSSHGENISRFTNLLTPAQVVQQHHNAWFSSPGHRTNIFGVNSAEFGSGLRFGDFQGTNNHMATQVFAGLGLFPASLLEDAPIGLVGNPLMTGVVFEDTVTADSFFTIGEGIATVTISAVPVAGGDTHQTVTGPTGGYAMRVPAGQYTVTATKAGKLFTQTVVTMANYATVGNRLLAPPIPGTGNRKVDFRIGAYADVAGRASTGDWWFARSTGTSFTNQLAGGWSPALTWVNVLEGDFNGDGRTDVAGRTSSGQWWLAKATGTGFVNELWGGWSTSLSWVDVLVGDFNGDGRDDIAGRTTAGDWWLAQSTGSSFSNQLWGGWSAAFTWTRILVGDFNANGSDDIAGLATNGQWWLARSTGSSFSNELWGGWSTSLTWSDIVVGDFNGDGRSDVAGRAANGDWWLAKSLGSSFTNELWGGWSAGLTWSQVLVGDFDGDGRDDIAGRTSGGHWWIARSVGTSFLNELWGGWSTSLIWDDVLVGDFNGDGRRDIAGRSSTGQWWLARSTGAGFTNELWGGWTTALVWLDRKAGHYLT